MLISLYAGGGNSSDRGCLDIFRRRKTEYLVKNWGLAQFALTVENDWIFLMMRSALASGWWIVIICYDDRERTDKLFEYLSGDQHLVDVVKIDRTCCQLLLALKIVTQVNRKYSIQYNNLVAKGCLFYESSRVIWPHSDKYPYANNADKILVLCVQLEREDSAPSVTMDRCWNTHVN